MIVVLKIGFVENSEEIRGNDVRRKIQKALQAILNDKNNSDVDTIEIISDRNDLTLIPQI